MILREGDEKPSKLDKERGARLAAAMRASGCKRAELAHLCQSSERQVTRWRYGDRIAEGYIDTICQRCEISREYLLFGDRPGVPAILEESFSAAGGNMGDGDNTLNQIRLHPLHENLIRHLRALPLDDQTSALDRLINNRWTGPLEPYQSGAPEVDGVPLDRYEIAAILALRAIVNPGREINLINHLITTRVKD